MNATFYLTVAISRVLLNVVSEFFAYRYKSNESKHPPSVCSKLSVLSEVTSNKY